MNERQRMANNQAILTKFIGLQQEACRIISTEIPQKMLTNESLSPFISQLNELLNKMEELSAISEIPLQSVSMNLPPSA